MLISQLSACAFHNKIVCKLSFNTKYSDPFVSVVNYLLDVLN
jgi:hypothetical protein